MVVPVYFRFRYVGSFHVCSVIDVRWVIVCASFVTHLITLSVFLAYSFLPRNL